MKELWKCGQQNIVWKVTLGLFIGSLLSGDAYFKGCSAEIIQFNFVLSVFCSVIIWTMSETISMWINKKYSWESEPLKKTLILIGLNLLVINALLLIVIPWSYSNFLTIQLNIEQYYIELIISILITTIVNLTYIGSDFYQFWKKSMYEAELLRKENIQSQLESLKSQLNPHFLFNSLNTLIAVIDENPEVAKNYVQNLSNVYRYTLQSKEKNLNTLAEELLFLDNYIYLLQIRFGDNLRFEPSINEATKATLIPALVLQLLVENAIKHNVVSSSRPLIIRLSEEENTIVVSNNLQPKVAHIESNKIGLSNMKERYKLLGSEEPVVIQSMVEFKVVLPIIYNSL